MSVLVGESADRSELFLVFIVWCVFAAFETLLFPMLAPAHWHVPLNARTLFESLLGAVVAFSIAFPLANRQLAKQRHAAFALWALAILAFTSFFAELVLEPLFFEGSPILIAGYPQMVETGTIALLLTAVRLLIHRRRNERRLTELQQANVEAELRYLKAQMNPHVLFNALNNIYSHALHGSEQTPTLILKLADMLRYVIYDCSGDDVTLEREVDFISDYIEIQKLAVHGRGTVHFQCSGQLFGKRIAPFLLIPFIENCFKHSLDTQEDNITIEIGLEATDEHLRLDCLNSFDLSALSHRARSACGVGLANVRRRLELLLGDDFTLITTPGDDQYRVQLSIPLQS